jgi:hypothetical protein
MLDIGRYSSQELSLNEVAAALRCWEEVRLEMTKVTDHMSNT